MYTTRFGNRVANKDSLLLGLTPFVKVLVLALAIASALLVNRWLGLVVVSCFTLVITGLAGMRLRHCMIAVSRFSWMLVFAFALNLIFPSGKDIEPLTVAAMLKGLYFSLRLGVIVICALTFAQAISPSDLSDTLMAFGRLRGRLGAIMADLATTTSLALRFAPILLEEAEKIRGAQLLRGRKIKGFRGRVAFTVDLIVPLIDSALRRAENLGYALEARGYGVRIPTSASLRIGRNEILMLAVSFGMLILVVSSEAL